MTRTLCTQYIDPMTIEPMAANRLIPMDKGEDAFRLIGVGEVLRRICVAKKDVVEASAGSLQLSAEQKSGSEAAIHAMHALCMLYLNQVTLMPYCSSTPLMHSTHATEQLHCTTSGFCVL